MSDTSILNQTIILGTNPDEVTFEVHDGHAFILLGPISIALPLTAQHAVDKLATVAAQAAADNRARRLREVA
ncbi:hypothetical protein TPA0906_65880 [Streptomyces olivaceus]|uniref:hypothetical protein n=1 Tax=Streptomyces olivaceus TaxID=47716 RepID=UPI001CC9DCE9|nr:hypothetical protein [Streptomyces olivaceus]MBZ6207456.1 hypothetical protein [Streptomyces olivaceus]GHJ04723.1 hypothetical protein TPA0906_65880 [Streptomyces olivaceus]